jgi:hypothetical protein
MLRQLRCHGCWEEEWSLSWLGECAGSGSLGGAKGTPKVPSRRMWGIFLERRVMMPAHVHPCFCLAPVSPATMTAKKLDLFRRSDGASLSSFHCQTPFTPILVHYLYISHCKGPSTRFCEPKPGAGPIGLKMKYCMTYRSRL